MTTLEGAGQQAARKQLEVVLADPLFDGARRLSSLLRYLVEEVLAGRGDQLKEYTLGVAVLDRGSAFDPRLDSIVRVEASKLRKRLETYYTSAGAKDPILIELPRGSYAPRIVPQVREADMPRSIGSIAVLPFVHLGSEPDGEYLSDGLTEEIIESLGTTPGMRVVSRTSAFQFKGKAGNIAEIGRTLGAEYLIEGSVRRVQDHIRVTARLIDAANGYRVWSQSYDKAPDNLFGIQVEIAAAIVAALAGQQLPSPNKAAGLQLSAEAYHLYLRGRFHRNQWTLEGFGKSVEYFQRALSLNPESAQILAALAEAETNRALGGVTPNIQQFGRARAYAERALGIEERCAQAHLSIGWIRQLYDWDWEGAQAAFDRALELNPSFAEAWHLKGISLALRRLVADAENSFHRALECDPLSLVIQTHTSLVPYFAGDLDEAEVRARAALTLESHFAEPYWVLGLIHERQRRYPEALEALQTAIRLGGENPIILGDIAFVHTMVGNLERARAIVEQLETGFPRPHPAASNLARVYLGLGEHKLSNAWLNEAFEARDVMLPWACADPRYQAMWTTPVMAGLRDRILGAAARS